MSISIITINEYKTRYPDTALNNIRDARIQSALNLSFSYLDVKTGCAISSRWNIVAPTAGYLTEEQKNYVKEAMYVETQYIISNNMDFSQGSDQTSFGSLSVSSSRPERKEVCESALMYLQKAGLYDYLQFSSISYAGRGCSPAGVPQVDPGNEYLTLAVGDNRYVAKNQQVANKWLKTNENGIVVLTEMTLDPTLYYTKGQVNNLIRPLQETCSKLGLGYLTKYQRDAVSKTISLYDNLGNFITFPYGGGGGGGTGAVNDVMVNGVSVVTAGIAEINLLNYATKLELASIIDDANASNTTTFSSNKIEQLFNSISGVVRVEVVNVLPDPLINNTMYYVKRSAESNVYDIRLYVNDTLYNMGSTEVDLSNYYTKTEANETFVKLLGNEAVSQEPYHIPYHIADLRFDATDSKIKANLMTITLDNNKTLTNYPLEVQIPSGSTYTAGDNIEIDNNVIKAKDVVTTNTVQHISAVKHFDNQITVQGAVSSYTGTDSLAVLPSYLDKAVGSTHYQYFLPNKTGTFALTSDLNNYVDKLNEQDISAAKTWESPRSSNKVSSGGIEIDDGNHNTQYLNSFVQHDNKLISLPTEPGTFALTSDIIKAINKGEGEPGTYTEGTIGQLYQDTTNGKLYICKGTSGASYIWELVGNDYIITGNGRPDASTVGWKGQLYIDKSNGDLYICTSTVAHEQSWKQMVKGIFYTGGYQLDLGWLNNNHMTYNTSNTTTDNVISWFKNSGAQHTALSVGDNSTDLYLMKQAFSGGSVHYGPRLTLGKNGNVELQATDSNGQNAQTLSITGGNSGAVSYSGSTINVGKNSSNNSFIEQADTGSDGTTYICGGYGTSNGAYMYLNGKSRATNAGWFGLTAKNASTSYTLQGRADTGVLSWNGSAKLSDSLILSKVGIGSETIKSDVSNSYFEICGGAAANEGSLIRLIGKDASSLGGGFQIFARTSESAYKEFRGTAGGSLTWGGKNVACETEKLSGGSAITLASGMSGISGNFITNVVGNMLLVSGLVQTVGAGTTAGWVTIGTLQTARTISAVATNCAMGYSSTMGFNAVPIQVTTGKLLQYYYDPTKQGTAGITNLRINITLLLS